MNLRASRGRFIRQFLFAVLLSSPVSIIPQTRVYYAGDGQWGPVTGRSYTVSHRRNKKENFLTRTCFFKVTM
jgi:hypothetical protein